MNKYKNIIAQFSEEELADLLEIARVGLADDSDFLADTLDRNEADLTALAMKLEKLLERQPPVPACKKCGSPLTIDDLCQDKTCPFSDNAQEKCSCGSGLFNEKGECQECGL